jgi:hypothetical protein
LERVLRATMDISARAFSLAEMTAGGRDGRLLG